MPKGQRTTPFLQWVGGKRQLLSVLARIITHKSLAYYEPFLGGGSVFFHFADRRRFQRAILNDANPELINCYEVVRDRLKELLVRLDTYRKEPNWDSRDNFLKIRAMEFDDPIEKAARTIYLNRTSFNSLYRVNQTGKFNSPFGQYVNPTLYNRASIEACSEALCRFATLRVGGFTDAVKDAKAGDLVYFDPPYIPVSKTSSFTAYTGQFGVAEQTVLANLFRDLFSRGVMVIQSNSDSPVIHKLYEDFDIRVVKAKRVINSKGDQRGDVNEVVIIGQPKDLKIDVPVANYLPDIFPLECEKCGNLYSSADIICSRCEQ